MKDGHGGVTIGSEMSGSVRNVYVENCRLSSPRLNQALRFKTNALRGGTIENVYFRNIEVGEVSDAVLQIDFYYDTGDRGPERPVVRNIQVSSLTAQKARHALFLKGFPERAHPRRTARQLLDLRSGGAECGRKRGRTYDGQGENQSLMRRRSRCMFASGCLLVSFLAASAQVDGPDPREIPVPRIKTPRGRCPG